MSNAEFSRAVRVRHLPSGELVLSADSGERAALAKRFGVSAIETLSAAIRLEADGEVVVAHGHLGAALVQNCAVSGEDFAVRIEEPVHLRFVRPVARAAEEDLELPDGEADEIEYEGEAIDIGEAVAQTLALAIDPYAEGPEAERIRAETGLASDDRPQGPLADLLEGLRKN